MNITKKERNSNLELLRIIAMLFIVASHFAVHGFGSLGSFNEVNFIIANSNNYLIYFLVIFGKIGVNVFVIISAYFMINSKFTFKKLLRLGGEVYFYSIMFLIIFSTVLFPAIPIGLGDVLISILPISKSNYGFITYYIVLMLLSPFLNKFIKELSRGTFLKLLLLLIFIWSIYPTFFGTTFGYSQISWFIVLYLIGSFINLHLDMDKINYKKLLIVLIASFALTYLASAIFGNLWLLFDITNSFSVEITFTTIYTYFTTENKFLILAISVVLFLIFLKRKEFSNKYINYIAGSALGVYLIHDNVFVRPYLWKYLLNIPSYYSSPNLVLVTVISIIGVYLICSGIDIIRRLTIEKAWIWIIDNKLNNIPNWFYAKFNLFSDKFRYYLK